MIIFFNVEYHSIQSAVQAVIESQEFNREELKNEPELARLMDEFKETGMTLLSAISRRL